MDRIQILRVCALPDESTITITALKTSLWGQRLTFHCHAISPDETMPLVFEAHFLDCREMKWQTYSHMVQDEDSAFPPTAWLNFRIGRSAHRRPAHLLTEHFGFSVVYGEFHIVEKGIVTILDGR